MRPLQLWLPTFNPSLSNSSAQRDMQRAFQAWHGERTIWLLPEIEKPCRWQESKMPWDKVLAIPAEHEERIDIYHINMHGNVWGVNDFELFSDASIEGLLDAWLNVFNNGKIKLYLCPPSVSLQWPRITGDTVEYQDTTFTLAPHNFIPVITLDEVGKFTPGWPARGLPPTVSPEAESYAHYGPFERVEEEGLPIVKGRGDLEAESIHICLDWPAPLDKLLHSSSGPDVLFHQGKMSSIAFRSADDPPWSLQEARNMASLYVSQGETLRESVWFLPAVITDGLGRTLKDVGRRFNLSALDWKDAWRSPKWRACLTERIEITRAWGPIGLFWALLIEELEGRRRFLRCERCGQLIQGKRGKRYCNQDDNRTCYTARTSGNTARQRERKRQRV